MLGMLFLITMSSSCGFFSDEEMTPREDRESLSIKDYDSPSRD
ncbi:hypothetical protein ADICYQ_5996 [Cyclobacterium qasimii M12-11B]|uniref:Uncharacterized protein n=1 Tax=Cyclobacterium qasimii M12-11B TaxID=641524 RepID=S7V628_9BACT|nr:hypothetical protein ADICYQ_5996 [Cyclobacterium qasimii M12-11B]